MRIFWKLRDFVRNMTKKTSKKTATKTEDGLNLKQEEFCKLFANAEFADRDFFGNGTQCYLEVYGYKDDENQAKITYETARANASRLLTKANIINRINELLETGGFNDQNIDKQHLFLINQFADLKTKIAAIKEYNTLKRRVENKIEIGLPIKELSETLNNWINSKK